MLVSTEYRMCVFGTGKGVKICGFGSWREHGLVWQLEAAA